MTMKTVIGSANSGNVYMSKMAVNESFEGYLVGVTVGEFGPILQMQREDGTRFAAYTTGSAKYTPEKLQDGTLVVGRYTQITYTHDRLKGKDGKPFRNPSKTFAFAQDDEKTVPVTAVLADSAITQIATAENIPFDQKVSEILTGLKKPSAKTA